MDDPLTISRRQEIFMALVTAQDNDINVSESRKLIMQQFAVGDEVFGEKSGASLQRGQRLGP